MAARVPSARGLALVLAFLWTLACGAAVAAEDAKAQDLSNKSCLSCHGGKQPKIEVPGSGDDKRALRHVDDGKFGDTVHGQMQCVDCHRDIANAAKPHTKVAGEKRPDCIGCHEEQARQVATYKTGAQRYRIRQVLENILAYKASSHAKASKDDPSRPKASCNDCHNVHEFEQHSPGTPEADRMRLSVSDRCGTCHEEHIEEWSASVHGRLVKEKKDPKAANCADCHTAHSVARPRASEVKLAILASCGNCHEEAYRSYRSTYHGQVATLGYAYTAKCFDCHGAHDIEPSTNPKAKTHLDNRLETCQTCHSGKKDIPLATAGFVSFSPHGKTDDFANHPQIWIAHKMMIGLLVGTFGFFWLHTLLWFWREYRERRERLAKPMVRLEAVGASEEKPGRHFQRFSAVWRAAHLLFALSLMTLTVTGISLFYPEAPWARGLMEALGGPKVAGLVHRINAVVFAGVFFWHLAYVLWRIGRNWKSFTLFGPNSLIPGLQDLKDIVAMFNWFFGRAPRPVFDRWTYWEKFDYWAPFWGVTIIGVSGALLWVPHVTAEYLPGWVFNVATIFHGEEAFLAVVFLFTVHFFNNHFRPDKFPLDIVMFTGTTTLEELKREHPLQYQRLLESGELERHLVRPPSGRMVLGSKVLGFTLIAVGLTLLTLVAIGFFTSF